MDKEEKQPKEFNDQDDQDVQDVLTNTNENSFYEEGSIVLKQFYIKGHNRRIWIDVIRDIRGLNVVKLVTKTLHDRKTRNIFVKHSYFTIETFIYISDAFGLMRKDNELMTYLNPHIEKIKTGKRARCCVYTRSKYLTEFSEPPKPITHG